MILTARRLYKLGLSVFATITIVLCLTDHRVSAEESEPSENRAANMLSQSESGIRLILLIVVDQLRADRLSPALPGGLGRIAREGRVYRDAVLAHAVSETCPGHATLLSGRYPGPMGIPSNHYVDRPSGEKIYCVADPRPSAAVFGRKQNPANGRSPVKMRFDGFARWLKDRHPDSRVMSVAGKDRAAIAMVGRNADVAWWYSKADFGFTTSRHYIDSLPGWLANWHGEESIVTGMLKELPDHWDHDSNAPGPFGRRDDHPGESNRLGRVSGHPLRDADTKKFLDQIYASPYLDQLILEFAAELVQREHLGTRSAPDLLAISLSATDIVGHQYGPESHEARDALSRLDRDLGKFLAMIEARVGREGLFVVLTADHGVLALPGWLQETGRSQCPVPGGQLSLLELSASLSRSLNEQYGPRTSDPGMWFDRAGLGLTFNRSLAAETDVSIGDLVATTKRVLEAIPGVRHVWSESEIQRDRSATADLYRHSFDPERSADLYLELDPTCLLRASSIGTTHGGPHLYDRAVPLVFLGPGVVPGSVSGTVGTLSIAPTLIEVMGLPAVKGLDGPPLNLRAPTN